MKQSAKYPAFLMGMAFVFVNSVLAQKPDATSAETPKRQALDVPIPPGQKANGVRFPYFEDGKLRMFFNVDVMFRKDLGHLEMTNGKIETYDEDGKPDMTVLMPLSVLDLNTRIVTSEQPFLVRRTDFALVGQTLQLDTNTRQGKVTGRVKMLIFNYGDSETGKK